MISKKQHSEFTFRRNIPQGLFLIYYNEREHKNRVTASSKAMKFSDSDLAEFSQIYESMQIRDDEYSNGRTGYIQKGGDRTQFAYDWSQDMKEIIAQINTEDDSEMVWSYLIILAPVNSLSDFRRF